MTPAARHAAAILVLDQIAEGVRAERALLAWSRGARYAGSKDRAAVRDIIFDVLRARLSCKATGGGATGRALVAGLLRLHGQAIEEVFTGQGHAPSPLSAGERALLADTPVLVPDVPDWLKPMLDNDLSVEVDGFYDGLRHRAPVFLRVNTGRVSREEAQERLLREGIATELHPDVKTCLKVLENPRKVSNSDCFLSGLVELQDASSQAVILATDVEPTHRVLDYCAGGGGKALAFAALGARVEAHDIDPGRMADLPSRAKRAGAQVTQVKQPKGDYDLVFCDAPCSGSGSWRRSPEGKWALTQARLDELNIIQQEILNKAKTLVAPNGRLGYATCSVLAGENMKIVDKFLQLNPSWSLDYTHSLFQSDQGDGFFVALMSKN